MSAPVQHVSRVYTPTAPIPVTADQRYWTSFKNQLNVSTTSTSPITSITVPGKSQSSSQLFAVTTSPRIQLLSTVTSKVVRSINRVAGGVSFFSAHVRYDDKLVAAGTSSCLLQVFDTNSRAILKTWKEHQQGVHATRWHPTDKTMLLSASDDGTTRLWSLMDDTSRGVWGHPGGEYLRCAEWMGIHPGWENTWVTGCYDGVVRVWDQRVDGDDNNRGCVMAFKMADPVEAVLPLPGATQICASAGMKVAALDLVAAKPTVLLKNHQRTVTSLALASSGTRLLTGGLDGHVKVFEMTGWNMVAGLKFSSAVLAMNVVSRNGDSGRWDDKHLVVGLQSGTLCIRTRLVGAEKVKEREKNRELNALATGDIEVYDRKRAKKERKVKLREKIRQIDEVNEDVNVVIDGNPRSRKIKLAVWEQALRKNEFAEALDLMMNCETMVRNDMITLLTALRHRSALHIAFQSRDTEAVKRILMWLNKAVNDPRHCRLIVDVAILVLDLYARDFGSDKHLDQLVINLQATVRRNVELANQACATLGMLDFLNVET